MIPHRCREMSSSVPHTLFIGAEACLPRYRNQIAFLTRFSLQSPVLNQIHKLFTSFCLIESPGKIRSSSNRILFFYTTHLHTHVFGFHYHHYPKWIQCFLNTLFDLQCHAFLHLQAMREYIDYTGYLAQPGDIAVRNISTCAFP